MNAAKQNLLTLTKQPDHLNKADQKPSILRIMTRLGAGFLISAGLASVFVKRFNA